MAAHGVASLGSAVRLIDRLLIEMGAQQTLVLGYCSKLSSDFIVRLPLGEVLVFQDSRRLNQRLQPAVFDPVHTVQLLGGQFAVT